MNYLEIKKGEWMALGTVAESSIYKPIDGAALTIKYAANNVDANSLLSFEYIDDDAVTYDGVSSGIVSKPTFFN